MAIYFYLNFEKGEKKKKEKGKMKKRIDAKTLNIFKKKKNSPPPVTSLLLGKFLLGGKVGTRKFIAVILVTVGITSVTFASSESKPGSLPDGKGGFTRWVHEFLLLVPFFFFFFFFFCSATLFLHLVFGLRQRYYYKKREHGWRGEGHKKKIEREKEKEKYGKEDREDRCVKNGDAWHSVVVWCLAVLVSPGHSIAPGPNAPRRLHWAPLRGSFCFFVLFCFSFDVSSFFLLFMVSILLLGV